MGKFSSYEYRNLPGFDMNTFEGANQAIPMKTLVIHCLDPRAVEIPQAVADFFGDEVYPGEIITDENGTRVGSTRTLFTATNAGGRAAFALEVVAARDYLFHVQNVVVDLQPLMNTNAGNANAATISNRLLMYRPFRMSAIADIPMSPAIAV